MQNLFQRGRKNRKWPLWLRLFAIACLAMICVMSTVQAFHAHDQFSSTKQHSRNNGPSSDDHCPLCVAMHSALPVSLHSAAAPMLHVHTLDSAAADAERIFRWRFEMASRPPPADQNCA